MTSSLPTFPQGLRSTFDVVSQTGAVGNKTWVVRDLNSQVDYQLEPSTIKGWEIAAENPTHSHGPSIIVTLKPSMVAMLLSTGEFYGAKPPPSGLRRR